VEQIFKKNFDNGWDFEGAAFAACHDGKMVVDLWGGFADSTSARIWQENTMALVFSTTKAVSALCLAMLVDRGLVSYDDNVTKYWPEFGHNGKENITVKMLASHEAALVVIDEPITFDVIRDWTKMSAAFEKQKPNWEIGTGAGYHAMTFGWLIDQLVRRVDHKNRSLGEFFREEVAQPYNLDFYIGLPLELEYRVARIIQPRIRDVLAHLTEGDFLKKMYSLHGHPADSHLRRLQKNPDWLSLGASFYNNPEFHSVEIGAANGIGTARALAQLFCLVDSGKILNKTLVDEIIKPVLIGQVDHVMHFNLTWGWGFIHSKNLDGSYQMGHPGFGGQNVKYDPHYGLSMGYVRNGLSPDFDDSWSFTALQNAVYEVVMKKSS